MERGHRLRSLLLGLILAGFTISVVAMVIDILGTTRNGMPVNSFTLERSGRYFWVGRGGGPIEGRALTEITPEQFQSRRGFSLWARALGAFGVGLGMVSGTLLIFSRLRHR